MESQRELQLLLAKSAVIGSDHMLIQGAGGNVSIKSGDAMLVKASGTCLRDAEKQNIFVTVSRTGVLDMLRRAEENFASLVPGSFRPSIETPLHALMPQPVVVHAHCIHTITRSVMGQTLDEFQALLPDATCAFIPYRRPGLPLAYAVQQALQAGEPNVLIMQNHGVVVGGDTVEQTFDLLDYVREKLAVEPRATVAADEDFLRQRNDCQWTIPDNALWHTLATDAATFVCAGEGVFYPDHVVFLGTVLPVAEHNEAASVAVRRLSGHMLNPPRYLLYRGKGLLVAGDLFESESDMLDALALVCTRIRPTAPLSTLSASDVDDLVNWDAEKFRRSLGLGEGTPCSGR